jgi:hypothetical protein
MQDSWRWQAAARRVVAGAEAMRRALTKAGTPTFPSPLPLCSDRGPRRLHLGWYVVLLPLL